MSRKPPERIPRQAPGMAVPPATMLASDLLRLNCVSRYLGRKKTKPEMTKSSMQAAKQDAKYTRLVNKRQTLIGKSMRLLP